MGFLMNHKYKSLGYKGDGKIIRIVQTRGLQVNKVYKWLSDRVD